MGEDEEEVESLMNDQGVFYALSTLKQTCAALAAFVGAVGDFIALGATDPVGECGGPSPGVLMNAQRLSRAVRTLDQVTRLHARGQLDKQGRYAATPARRTPSAAGG